MTSKPTIGSGRSKKSTFDSSLPMLHNQINLSSMDQSALGSSKNLDFSKFQIKNKQHYLAYSGSQEKFQNSSLISARVNDSFDRGVAIFNIDKIDDQKKQELQRILKKKPSIKVKQPQYFSAPVSPERSPDISMEKHPKIQWLPELNSSC